MIVRLPVKKIPAVQKPNLQLVKSSVYHTKTTAFENTIIILVVSLLIRTIVAATLPLTEDEAWYWSLSKKVQLSYTVHPPLSIWMIALFSKIFGDGWFAVRAPALICSGLGSAFLVRLASKLGWKYQIDTTAIFCLTTPFLFLGGLLSGPDLPLFLFWSISMNLAYEIGTTQNPKLTHWILLGGSLGLALLSKYTGLLSVLCTTLWFLICPNRKTIFKAKGFYFSFAMIVLISSPVFYWNFQKDFSSFDFQFHDRHSGSLSFSRWGLFWISQLILFTPAVVLGWSRLLFESFVKTDLKAGHHLKFLGIWALIPGIVFFIQPLFSPFKVHWAFYSYLPVLIYFSKNTASENLKQLRSAITLGTVVTTLSLSFFYLPLNAPSIDLYGWPQLISHLDSLPSNLKSRPLVSNRYQVASQIAFALKSQNRVQIHPHDSFEVRDWGGPESPPGEFLFIQDLRFNFDSQHQYPNHHCKKISHFTAKRFSQNSKSFEIYSCEKKASSGT